MIVMQCIYIVIILCYNIDMQFNQFPTKTVSGIALSGALLTGCSGNPELTFSPERVTPAQAEGFIYDDVNVRTSPQRIENEAANNSCGKTDAAVLLESVSVAVSQGIGNDSNGNWIGVRPEDLPSDIAEDCKSEYGGMLWIAQKYVNAAISEGSVPVNTASER